ncbi:MAG: 4Fe-4S binding protein [Peptostreptococcaceae bacterium]|jgi:iron only hydrogenase large subunit-like protein|nr:4Fe-4S binding protein [Peptostreptococcaceae bacterium]
MDSIINYSNENCINCKKCLRACPVDAIKVIDKKTYIIDEKCIGCLECVKACEFDAKVLKSDVGEIKEYLKLSKLGEENVIALLNPLIFLDKNINEKNFDLIISKVLKKLKFIGFDKIYIENKGFFILNKLKYKNSKISSFCPISNEYIIKYKENQKKNLLNMDPPFIIDAKEIKKNNKDSKIVYINHCDASKWFVKKYNYTDYIDKVISFYELEEIFNDLNLNINMDDSLVDGFKLSYDFYDDKDIVIYKECIIKENFDLFNKDIKAYWCENGCLNGTGFFKESYLNRKINFLNIKEKLNKTDYKVENYNLNDYEFDFSKIKYTESEIDLEYKKSLLNKIDNNFIKNHIDCRACGYETCESFFDAHINNYIDLDSCLLNLYNNKKNLNNKIFDLTSNYIFIVSFDFKIINLNQAAINIIDKDKKDLIGEYIGHYIEMDDFIDVLYEKNQIISSKLKSKKLNRYLVGDVFYLKKEGAIIAIYKDISELENERDILLKMKEDTLQTSQTLINKQMEITKEITSLLAESTAETKIILSRLKDIGRGN